ncbi:MAG: hypothetical protein RIS64_2922, partial [Bacteroidota bacterium]
LLIINNLAGNKFPDYEANKFPDYEAIAPALL